MPAFVQNKVNTAKEVMLKNMENMMIRQDKLETMVDKSDGLLDAVGVGGTRVRCDSGRMTWD